MGLHFVFPAIIALGWTTDVKILLTNKYVHIDIFSRTQEITVGKVCGLSGPTVVDALFI